MKPCSEKDECAFQNSHSAKKLNAAAVLAISADYFAADLDLIISMVGIDLAAGAW